MDVPLDLDAKIKVCNSARSAVNARQLHRHTDDVKTITPSADTGCKKISREVLA